MSSSFFAIEVRAVSRRYAGVAAVEQASLALRAGRITCLLGPSGAGKSTLLRAIAGLEDIDAGEILRRGEAISRPGFTLPPEHRDIGLVFQDLALFPHLTAAQNIGFGLNALPAAARQAKVAALLEQFRLSHRAGAFPHTLSGGEQQRVAIARALAREPVAVLLDEPFSGLDGRLRDDVRGSVIEDMRAAGAAAMIVTHDPEEALQIADELVLMAEGRVLQAGSPDACYLRPVSLAAARLLGDAYAFEATVAGGFVESVLGRFPAEAPAGAVQLIVRPESFRLDPQGISARVLSRRFVGAFWELTVALRGRDFRVRLTEQPVEADSVNLSVHPHRACLAPYAG